MRESAQLWFFGLEEGREAVPPRCSPLCVAIILEAKAALDLDRWPHSGRVDMIRGILRGKWARFSNRRGLTGQISNILGGDFPMTPEFRAEMESLRPHAKEKLPFKII